MSKERAWPVRLMYLFVAAALALSLTVVAAPASNVRAATDEVVSKWERVSTPTLRDAVLAPNSTIIDYALGDGGDVAYTIFNSTAMAPEYWKGAPWFLAKSEDGAATWGDITEALEKVDKTGNITSLVRVATDGVVGDFVAVALVEKGELRVYISKDGGSTFKNAGQVKDGASFFASAAEVSDLAVSAAAGGKRTVAIAGTNNATNATQARLFRCTVTGDSAGAWEDATDAVNYPGWYGSILVTDIIFSPSWTEDSTILAVTVNGTIAVNATYFSGTVHLQSGTLAEEGGGAWNSEAGFADAVPVKTGVDLPIGLAQDPHYDARLIAGVALPSDYAGDKVNTRWAWVWVNYEESGHLYGPRVGEIFRVKNALRTPVREQIENMPWLTNVSYLGTIQIGKAIAGVLGDGDGRYATGCAGISVYHYPTVKEMDICCPAWDLACKAPTGRFGMAISYVSEEKAYAVALLGKPGQELAYDEGAWSVSLDGNGLIWNQLSFVDTNIDYLSDVAVSPDCNKMMLVSVNVNKVQIGYGCDSVWLKAGTLHEAPEYSGKWLRTWTGQLKGVNSDVIPGQNFTERGLLRLAPEEDDGKTVYLVDRMTSTIYYNDLETWNCWELRSAATRIDKIVDLAVKNKTTIYALDDGGDVTWSEGYGKAITWKDAVKSGVKKGWTIAVRGEHVLVGGQHGDWNYSKDGGKTWIKPEPKALAGGLVTVAFDSYFDQNKTIYAALANAGNDNGIYRWAIDTSESWNNMAARPYDYTGLVLGYNPGNPKTSAKTGGVLYASYLGEYCADSVAPECQTWQCWHTGVARSLNPAESIECKACVEWDYLTVGLTPEPGVHEQFNMAPYALKLCGCRDNDSNTKLFAIDGRTYDTGQAKIGTVWTFEDCYAKKAPEIKFPTQGAVIPSDPCSCYNAPFTIKWDALCDACVYEIEYDLDEEFSSPKRWFPPATAGEPSYLVPGGEEGALLSCEMTYYLRIRAVKAGTCQEIRSWWSEPVKITIAPFIETAKIKLVSPAPGALNQPTKNPGFSWDLDAAWDKFDWVLSKNADLSSPLDSKTGLTSKATTYTGTLTYATTYYWQVKAYKDGALIGTSAVGTFTTAAQGAFCCPQCGLCFDTQQQLQDHLATHGPAPTPFWVWIVIAIGAVLVIVVIILIFRTRRV